MILPVSLTAGGRADIRLALGGDGEIYVLSKSDGLFRKLVAVVSSPAADTAPPSAPTSLTATAASATQINLIWPAATDNVGVTAYRVERCQGAGCTAFTQIATTTGMTYSNTGLSPSTRYSYRVKAVDAAGNVGAASPVKSATTKRRGKR